VTGSPAIADHGLIGDLRTAALASAGGTVDWLCLPRFDSPASSPRCSTWIVADASASARRGSTHLSRIDSATTLDRRLDRDAAGAELRVPAGRSRPAGTRREGSSERSLSVLGEDLAEAPLLVGGEVGGDELHPLALERSLDPVLDGIGGHHEQRRRPGGDAVTHP
jgi:hypothetical protein